MYTCNRTQKKKSDPKEGEWRMSASRRSTMLKFCRRVWRNKAAIIINKYTTQKINNTERNVEIKNKKEYH